MAQKNKSARIVRWRGEWYMFYTDYLTGKKKRVACESKGATNKELRRELVNQQRSVEKTQEAEVTLLGGKVSSNTKLLDEVKAYVKRSEARARTRAKNPDARRGLSQKSLEIVKDTMKHFSGWLEEAGYKNRLTRDITPQLFNNYIDLVTTDPIKSKSKSGSKVKKQRMRSAATINCYKRYIRACLSWINGRRPRRFADFAPLLEPLKPTGGKSKPRVSFNPDKLQRFYAKAVAWQDPSREVEVKPAKDSRKKQNHTQVVSSVCSTPVSRLFLLLALTGCRLGEALSLKWNQVDLELGKITVEATKTGLDRELLLAGDPAGEIAPRMAVLLRQWHSESESEYVLPHGNLDAPIFPKGAWYSIAKAAELSISPQKLRQNFTSYAASLGVPESVAALWQGHSSAVAKRYYRTQLLDRNKGNNFEEGMGLVDILDELIGDHEGPKRAIICEAPDQSGVGISTEQVKESVLAKLASSLAYLKTSVSIFTEKDSIFRPDDEMFTVAQHIAHVAITLDRYMEPLIGGEGFDTDLDGLAQRARGVVSLNTAMHMVEKAYSGAIRFISDQDEAYLMTPLPDGPIMGGAPRIAVVDKMVSHTAYHCGSLAVYARLADKIPAMPYEMVNDDGPKRARLSE
ncbi:MAG: tyrosine-type recombinase/integrase [Planctomycetota bacterium]